MIFPENHLAIEEGIAVHCGLSHRPKQNDFDANDEFGNLFELKYTAKAGVKRMFSIATHNITTEIVQRWKSMYWIGTIGDRIESKSSPKFEVSQIWIVHPDKLQPFFKSYEKRLLKRNAVADRMRAICKADKILAHDLKVVDMILERGTSLCNGPLDAKLFRQGVLIDTHDSTRASEQVKDYVRANPIHTLKPESNSLCHDFFTFENYV